MITYEEIDGHWASKMDKFSKIVEFKELSKVEITSLIESTKAGEDIFGVSKWLGAAVEKGFRDATKYPTKESMAHDYGCIKTFSAIDQLVRLNKITENNRGIGDETLTYSFNVKATEDFGEWN